MESKPSEAGKLSAAPAEGAGGGSGGGGVSSGPSTTSQTPATTTGVTSFPRLPPLPSSSSSTAGGTATSGAQPRGGLAIGVPAHHSARSQSPFTTFGPSPPSSVQHQHQHHFLSPIHRGPDSSPSSTSQVRSVSPSIQNIGMFASLNASQLRPTGPTASQPQRPGQAPIRSTTPTSSNAAFNQQQRMATQGMSRPPSSMLSSSRPPSSMPSPSGPPPPSSLVQQMQMQMHGPSSIPPPSASPFRPPQQRPPQTLQQTRPPQALQQTRPPQTLQQTRPSYHGPMQHLQQTPQNTPFPSQPPTSPFLQQASRVPAAAAAGMLPPGEEMGSSNVDVLDSGDKIITKKTIQDLFFQIDPSEKLEANVEDALIEVAEDFVESLTTFACSLAKHRKSATLETRDILLHAEKNWNIQLPGFSGDEIKLYRKQNVSDIHRERLQLIKKSMGDHRSHAPKATAPALTSPAPTQHRP